MKRICRAFCLWLADCCHRPPMQFREHFVGSPESMLDLQRQLLRQIRARLRRERPTWRIETTV